MRIKIVRASHGGANAREENDHKRQENARSRQCRGAQNFGGKGAPDNRRRPRAHRRRARRAEVQASGKIAGAVHVSRGMLEFRADPDLPSHDPNFSKDEDVILYCASAGRAALAGKMLKDLGYERVYNLGGFKDWADSGGAIDK